MKRLKIFTYIFHPLLFITYTLIFLLYQQDSYLYYVINQQGRDFIILLTLLLTVIAPIITILYLKYTHQVHDIALSHRKDRIIPLIIITIYTCGLYFIFHKIAFPSIITAIFVVAIVIELMLLAITFFWKINIYMTGISACIGVILALINMQYPIESWIIPMLFILCGVLGSISMWISDSTQRLSQVLLGWALGLLCAFISLTLYL